VYIFGDTDKDQNVVDVGNACERVMDTRKGLKPYVLPKTDLCDVVKENKELC
jgi:hypothetical protein